MPAREDVDHFFGDLREDQRPTLPVARRLPACLGCGFELDLERPSFSCPACGRDLSDHPPAVTPRPSRPAGQMTLPDPNVARP